MLLLVLTRIRLSVCPYIGCMRDLPDIVRLRHLVLRSVPISHSPFCITIGKEFKKDNKSSVKKLLHMVKFFPKIQTHGEPSSNSDAVSWLSMGKNTEILERLREFAGSRDPVASEADIFS
jgi:hypothetical protein